MILLFIYFFFVVVLGIEPRAAMHVRPALYQLSYILSPTVSSSEVLRFSTHLKTQVVTEEDGNEMSGMGIFEASPQDCNVWMEGEPLA